MFKLVNFGDGNYIVGWDQAYLKFDPNVSQLVVNDYTPAIV